MPQHPTVATADLGTPLAPAIPGAIPAGPSPSTVTPTEVGIQAARPATRAAARVSAFAGTATEGSRGPGGTVGGDPRRRAGPGPRRDDGRECGVPAARPCAFARARAALPGLALTVGLAALAFALRLLPGAATFSPMIVAIVLGIAFHNLVGTPVRAKPGVAFTLRRVLRLAIVLLGLQLTASELVEVGGAGLAIIAASLGSTFLFTVWLGRRIGVEPRLAELIAAGTSICGASAVIATNTVTRAADEDVAYAVACVTVFGSLAMFLYPVLPAILRLDPHAYGLWAGASIHEIAQVVAAAFQHGPAAGESGTIAKLSRVMLLAPTVLALGFVSARRAARADGAGGSRARVPVPWFVLGFVALVALNGIVEIPADARRWSALATTFLLSMALAAMGLETDVRKLRAKGLRPLALGAAAWAFIALFSLALVELVA